MGFFQVLARAGDKSSAKAPEKGAELAQALLARDIVFNAPSHPHCPTWKMGRDVGQPRATSGILPSMERNGGL